ncbi:MAG TPA: PorP/SprF family type IX secretion system membrane protein [Bacteroidales bacterium]|nr:PorP/SprF family type IX secretion system membrane protein [Bacteroidales bacterium]HSA44726.1 PorP/SprF family type IX secretion system membrane protein [Bacteroidales bacterium]
MKKITTIIILAIFGLTSFLQAQQYPYLYQYILNKYSLSPAYAGLYGIPEGYLGYRQSRINVNYTPKTLGLNLNAPLTPKVGLGLNVMNDQADIFNNLWAIASYTYHLQLAENHFLDFSLTGGLNQKSIDLSNIIDNPAYANDPVINNRREINESSLEIGGALMYRFKKLNVGAFAPSLYENNSTIYAFKKHFIGHASYDIGINDNWSIEPVGVIRYTMDAPLNFDVTAIGKYKNKYLAALTYKRNTILAASIGGEITSSLVFMYTYDMNMPRDKYVGVLGDNWGGHELTVGYRFGTRKASPTGEVPEDDLAKALKTKARVTQVDSLTDLAKQMTDDLKKLSDSLAALRDRKIEFPGDDLKALEDEIKKLNAKILTMTGTGDKIAQIAKTVYFVTASAEITEYSKKKLDDLVLILKEYPTLSVKIEGHTDSRGTESYNQDLSDRRAASVKSYLMENGIAVSRISSVGYGELRPIDSNDTPEGRLHNRRVEIRGE